jgi:signal transduction histidine kinase
MYYAQDVAHHPMWTPFRRLLIAVLLAAKLAGASSAQEKATAAKKQIVVLYSYRTLMPVNADWDRGIRRGFTAGFQDPVDMNVEYLDLARNEDEQYMQNWINLLSQKYGDRKIDLVLPVYSPALEFALSHRDTLFLDVPIVFCTASRNLGERARREAGVTGVVFQMEFEGTFQAARALFPDTEQMLVVSGASDRDKAFRDSARRVFDQYDEELEIDYVEGLPLPQLLETMAEVRPRTIVLALIYDKDQLGNDHVTREVVQELAEVCPAPVFGLHDTLLGHGIVGGNLLLVEKQGELAGEMAARVLRGEDPEAISVVGLGMNQLTFDDRELQRWRISKRALPPNSEVRFREPTFWKRYGAYALTGLSLLVFQSIIIAVLAINRSRRVRAERSLHSSRTEARELSGKLLTAQEDERKRLARELHDDLTQRLAASAITAGGLEQRFEDSSPDARDAIAQLKHDLISLSDDVHRISRQIHPAILDDLGLADAMGSECERFGQHHAIDIRLRCGDIPKDLPKDVSLCLYRITQEALWNIAKHANTDRVDVTLATDAETAHLEVRDFGIGFNKHELNGRHGLGLASMEERVRLIGGTLDVDSAPGSGTSVSVSIPLSVEQS